MQSPAKILWQQWSPNWRFDEACFERTAVAHDTPEEPEAFTAAVMEPVKGVGS
jgi:hypothetical protein